MSRDTRQENKSAKTKRALALIRRMNVLSDAMRGRPWVPLAVPERAGWQRYFVVRPDIARSPQGPRLERLLNKCLQNVVRSPRKDFKEKNYKTKQWVPITQHLRALAPKDWETLLPAEKLMFRHTFLKKKGWRRTYTEEAYVFEKEWQFEFRIRPYYFTHRQVINDQLEREYQEVWDEFNGNLMWRYIDRKWTNREPYDRTPESILLAAIDREVKDEI